MSDISDYIPILVAVAYGIYHLFGFMGKKNTRKPPASPQRPSRPAPSTGGGNETGWDDLLEALGQKEKPKGAPAFPPANRSPRIDPVRPKYQEPLILPPPHPAATLPKLPEIPRVPVSGPISESYEFYQPTIANASELKFKNYDSDNADASHAPTLLSSPLLPAMNAQRFRKFLGDRERIREAIVLNEILGKPVALR